MSIESDAKKLIEIIPARYRDAVSGALERSDKTFDSFANELKLALWFDPTLPVVEIMNRVSYSVLDKKYGFR